MRTDNVTPRHATKPAAGAYRPVTRAKDSSSGHARLAVLQVAGEAPGIVRVPVQRHTDVVPALVGGHVDRRPTGPDSDRARRTAEPADPADPGGDLTRTAERQPQLRVPGRAD